MEDWCQFESPTQNGQFNRKWSGSSVLAFDQAVAIEHGIAELEAEAKRAREEIWAYIVENNFQL